MPDSASGSCRGRVDPAPVENTYDVQVDGRIHWKLSEGEIHDLYVQGTVRRDTVMRRSGSDAWSTVDDCLPLLKYGTRPQPESPSVRPSRAGTGMHYGPIALPVVLLLAVALTCYSVLLERRLPARQGTAYSASHSRVHSGQWSAAPQSVYAFPSAPISGSNGVRFGPGIQPNQSPFGDNRLPSIAPPARTFGNQGASAPAMPTAPVALSPQRPVKAPEYEEMILQLDTSLSVSTKYGVFGLRVYDHGPVTISVWINGTGPQRIDKQKGFDRDGNNLLQIYRFPNAKVYYVDRVGVPLGKFVIRIVPDT